MDPISWYLFAALPTMRSVFSNAVLGVMHYFSFGTLLRTLFAPWKREVAIKKRGFSLDIILEELSFNLISRFIGLWVRATTLLIGVVALVMMVILLLVVFVTATLLPVFLLPFYYQFISERQKYRSNHTYEQIIAQLTNSYVWRFILKRTQVDEQQLKNTLLSSPVSVPDLLKQSRDRRDSYEPKIDEAALFLHVYNSSKQTQTLFNSLDIDATDITRLLNWFNDWMGAFKSMHEFWTRDAMLSHAGIGKDWAYGYTIELDNFTEELTNQDLRNEAFVGRKEELERILEILSRGDQSDVLLYSDPGIGRHTLIKGLAKAIQLHLIPGLGHTRILLLQTQKLLSNTDPKDIPGRFRQLLLEAQAAGNIILVIDEFEALMSFQHSGIDITSVFEETLSSIQLIAITTSKDFLTEIKNDDTVMKFFTTFELEEMTHDQTFEVVVSHLYKLERQTTGFFTYQAIKRCLVDCEDVLINERFPEKAIDVIAETASYATSKQLTAILPQHIDTVISRKTDIPVGEIASNERDTLATLESELSKYIVEQDLAVTQIARTLRQARTGVKKQSKPLGSFLFLGPTGVGKTHTAKIIAKIFFKKSDFIRFDMAEYQTPEAIERLIGSSTLHTPGELSQKILMEPYNLVLLDEFEKAPTPVHNLFLSILDEGVFTDASGQKIDCRHTMIVATSNAGSEHLRHLISQGHDQATIEAEMTEYLLKHRHFSPELLNRFDGVIFYRPISQQGLHQIVKLRLEELKRHLWDEKQIEVTFHQGIEQEIVSQGYDEKFGARSIERYIDDVVADRLATEILNNPKTKQIAI